MFTRLSILFPLSFLTSGLDRNNTQAGNLRYSMGTSQSKGMPAADKACGRIAFKLSAGPAPDTGFLKICACLFFLMGALTVRHEKSVHPGQ